MRLLMSLIIRLLKGKYMQTITINRYGFNELSPDAQANALEKIRAKEYQDYPQDLLSEAMDQEASNLLFGNYDGLNKSLKLYYDLSHSQGSGVSFHGEIYASDKPNLTLPENCHRVEVTHSSRYYHEHSFDVELYDIDGEEIDGAESVTEQLRDICRQLKRYGYKWESDHFSDQSLKEYAIDAGEVFTSAGNWSDPERN